MGADPDALCLILDKMFTPQVNLDDDNVYKTVIKVKTLRALGGIEPRDIADWY